MKNFVCVTFFFFLFSLVSCSNFNTKNNNYNRTLNSLEEKSNFTQHDYIVHAKTLFELNRPEDAMPSILMYMLIDDGSPSEERSFAVDKFASSSYSDLLMIVCLLPSDGALARDRLKKAYTALGQTDKAKQIEERFGKD